MLHICIVGAGITGAVIAREFAEAGHDVLVIDEKNHVAGNCYTERDKATGIMVHKYGPHIFHTDNKEIWDYVSKYCQMVSYTNRVKAICGDRVYSLPVNLHTINQLFDKSLNPSEASEFITNVSRRDIIEPANFEEQALFMVGEKIYKTFFEGYTRKQWGIDPKLLPASILKRLPVRFNYDDNYYSHKYQGIPHSGYTDMIENILEHKNITISLNNKYEDINNSFDHVFYSGPLDRYFGYCYGRLEYRTLKFEEIRYEGDFQGNAVINYCDYEIPFTRITEHKYFAPWEKDSFSASICYKEYSTKCDLFDEPYYPIRFVTNNDLLAAYIKLALTQKSITFVGRLGTYRYIDMDIAVAEALDTARKSIIFLDEGHQPAVFFVKMESK